jgi:hypothetical protein
MTITVFESNGMSSSGKNGIPSVRLEKYVPRIHPSFIFVVVEST